MIFIVTIVGTFSHWQESYTDRARAEKVADRYQRAGFLALVSEESS